MKPELVTIRAGGLKWTVRKDLQPARSLLEDPDRCFSLPEAIIKDSGNVTIGRAGTNLIVRRLNYGKRAHKLRDTFRVSRARQAFRYGLLLEASGIATPRVIAVAEERQLRWPVRAYLITEEVPGRRTLAWFVWTGKRMPPQTIREVASLLARLHDSGLSHRDLKPSNILIDDNLKPFLIDLDAVRSFKRLPASRAKSDLLRLAQGLADVPAASPQALMRLLREYCRLRHIQSWREWWEEIAPEIEQTKVASANPRMRKAELSR